MKITNNNFFNLQKSVKKISIGSHNDPNNIKTSKKNCDEIIINSRDYAERKNTAFIEHLTKKVKDEVHTVTDSEKLNNLKVQIQEGTYNIDIDEIVKKMMLQ